MDAQEMEQRLSNITTWWTMLRHAHQGETDSAVQAQQELMQRYCGAVYRYLFVAVRDAHVAEDLTQEFALRFLRGRFHKAHPERGRFRDYVKSALFNLVNDYRKRQGQGLHQVPLGDADPKAPDSDASGDDSVFAYNWRQELLARTWKALAEHEAATGQPYHTVLRFRVENPDLPSPQQAEQLSVLLGKTLTAAGVRQTVHRAREKFAQLLVEETRLSLGTDAPERLEEELIDLNLLKYCQAALHKDDDKA
jgi:RNA polymerase sigma-70 factor (ECF subfamily)